MTGNLITPENFEELYATEVQARWAMFRRYDETPNPPHYAFAVKLLIVGTTFSEMVSCMYQGDEWVGAMGGLQWSDKHGWE